MSLAADGDEAPPPSLVAPGLYLGAAEHARRRGALHEYERPLDPKEGCVPIRTIINASASEPHHFASTNQDLEDAELDEDERALCFQYHRCIIQEDAEKALEQAACFAERNLKAKRPVLVHGGEGAEGSEQAAAVVAALLVRQQWSAEEAVQAVQRRRPSSCLSSAAMSSLALLEATGKGLQEPSLELPLDVLPPAAAEVVDGFLWLGNADAAEGVGQNAFDCLVNATASLPFPSSAPSRKLRVPLVATAGLQELASHWTELLSFLHAARAAGCRCLVYGTYGRSRPAALAMGYIMAGQGVSFAAALKAVRRKYPLAHPSAALVDAVTTLSSQPEEAAGKLALKAGAGEKGSTSSAAPLALENGSAKAALDEKTLEAAVRQLGELLPVPADLRREALIRFSGDIERAASQLISWLEGDVPQQTSGSSSSSVSALAAASASASASSSAAAIRSEPPAARKRSASEDGTAASEPRTEAPRLAQCYLEGQEQLPECVICGRSSKRGGSAPEPHQDLGWVHSVCLQQASWS